MHTVLQSIAARLPDRVQQEVNRARHGWQIRRHAFGDGVDPHFQELKSLVSPGDWVIDVGANIGQYMVRLSALVGPSGRVLAVEPVPATFELLATNARRTAHANITLLNLACSDRVALAGVEVPKWDSGLTNYYDARLAPSASLSVLCLPLDALQIPHPVSLIKVDAEGHDFSVLRGAVGLIERDHPAILLEEDSHEVREWLAERGYVREPSGRASPNSLYRVLRRDRRPEINL